MKNRYEALLALDMRGKEDAAKEVIERLEKDFSAEGADIEQVQRIERRELAYEHRHMKTAYFVNVVFAADADTPSKLRAKLKLDEDVTFHQIVRLSSTAPKVVPATA